MSATIRRARLADIAQIMAIRHAVRENRLSDPNSVTAAHCTEFIDRSEIWVWAEDDVILGFAAGDPNNGEIWALFVAPGHEGRGIGRALLSLACETLRNTGYNIVTLSTGKGTRAERFYREAGWIVIGRNSKGEVIFEKRLVFGQIEIVEARAEDAQEIADIHLAARRVAMPYLNRPHTDAETRDRFTRIVGDRPAAWWVARDEGQIVGYMLIAGESLDHLYVRPDRQRRGVGLSLLSKAKALSPRRLELWTFQRNTGARAFYEAQGFHAVEYTDGSNEEAS